MIILNYSLVEKVSLYQVVSLSTQSLCATDTMATKVLEYHSSSTNVMYLNLIMWVILASVLSLATNRRFSPVKVGFERKPKTRVSFEQLSIKQESIKRNDAIIILLVYGGNNNNCNWRCNKPPVLCGHRAPRCQGIRLSW